MKRRCSTLVSSVTTALYTNTHLTIGCTVMLSRYVVIVRVRTPLLWSTTIYSLLFYYSSLFDGTRSEVSVTCFVVGIHRQPYDEYCCLKIATSASLKQPV